MLCRYREQETEALFLSPLRPTSPSYFETSWTSRARPAVLTGRPQRQNAAIVVERSNRRTPAETRFEWQLKILNPY